MFLQMLPTSRTIGVRFSHSVFYIVQRSLMTKCKMYKYKFISYLFNSIFGLIANFLCCDSLASRRSLLHKKWEFWFIFVLTAAVTSSPRCKHITGSSKWAHIPWNKVLPGNQASKACLTHTSCWDAGVAVSLPPGGCHTPSIRPRPLEPVFLTHHVYGKDMGLTLTVFDISLFLRSYAVQSNPVWLFNREGWRTFFFPKTSDKWIAHKQDFVVYLAKQFPFALARV